MSSLEKQIKMLETKLSGSIEDNLELNTEHYKSAKHQVTTTQVVPGMFSSMVYCFIVMSLNICVI